MSNKHPSPWRWDLKKGERVPWALLDADGVSTGVVSLPMAGREGDDLPPIVRALTELAPEMEQTLRYFVDMLGDIRPTHPKMAAAMAILEKLDVARAVKL